MNNNVKLMIFEKIARSLQNTNDAGRHKIMQNLHLNLNKANGSYSYTLPLKSKDYNLEDRTQDIVKNDLQDVFSSITIKDRTASFNLIREKYIKGVLENKNLGEIYLLPEDSGKNVIVEFSSPNIAKPFHLGNLRSTIIGNYIANINGFLRNQVKKINYLGDWGTQFGFIQVGLELTNRNEEELKTNPIRALYKAYVNANKLAETDSTVADRAREIFRQLETGDNAIHADWETFKRYTIEELRKTYERVGVIFDEYHWESMYNAKHIAEIIKFMEEMQFLSFDRENRRVISLSEERNVPLIKSDGSTLYMIRDVAAAIDRFEKNNFDAMYYIVDNAQTLHFSNLIEILKKMNMPWAERLKHVKFGRIRGMSTRKGTAVFLEDILNEAKDVMKERQMQSLTTKVPLDDNDTSADILGVSAVIVNDLKQRRQKDYVFDWDTMFDMKGNSGIRLQYTHCRLVNLEHNCGAILISECDPSLLTEPEVDDLVTLIGKFDEIILKSYKEMEPCTLTMYLFQLSNAVNKAMKTLRIKGEPSDLGNQRLLLFHKTKTIFAQGMKLLGLTPLNKM